MRTRTKRALDFFRQRDRSCEVSGTINFWYPYKIDHEAIAYLREAIIDLDREFPWKDSHFIPGSPLAESIGFMSGANVREHDLPPEARHTCTFTIVPGIKHLRTSQVYAYERYLWRLASELKAKIKWVTRVDCVLNMTSISSFT